jgi:tetratricopeptide (TPR) repeat protein
MSAPAVAAERGPGHQTDPAPAPPHAAPGAGMRRGRLARREALWWPTLAIAGVACFASFYAKGSINVESSATTVTEMALTLGAGLLIAGLVALAPDRRPLSAGRGDGFWSIGLLLAFAALTALSIVWSVQPDASFREAGRMLAYGGVFAAAVVLARAAPSRWPAVLGGLALSAVAVCAYALATKVFPDQLDANDMYARLRAPYDYWNATGLTAAIGVLCCLWLGARRSGHALLTALAYPATGLLLTTLMLAYSRGALAALVIGLIAWFCLVPLRLRGAAVLIAGALGAGGVVAWDFSRHALSSDRAALFERSSAGHELGALLLTMLVVLTLVGLAAGFVSARRAPTPRTRRRAAAALGALIVLAIAVFVGAVAHSHRGLTGSVSHALDALTNPDAKPPPNTPGRLTAVASVRARYWKEALEVFDAHPALGAGAGGYQTARLRYRTVPLEVKHAHGFVVQTLADLGAAGLALALALALAWMAAAGRCTHPFNRRWSSWSAWRRLRSRAGPGWRRHPEPYTAERVGMLTMLCLVIAFAVHSLVDWTWYVLGDALVVLLCAGWLAGRGPLPGGSPSAPQAAPATASRTRLLRAAYPLGERLRALRAAGRKRIALAAAVVVGALLAGWTQWQPQRAVDASQQALSLLGGGQPSRALVAARSGVADDPLSAQALFTLARVQQSAGLAAGARQTLAKAVRLQPSNPETWLRLAQYDLPSDPRAALNELQAAIYLNPEVVSPEAVASGNPESIEVQNDYAQAVRASTPPPRPAPAARRRPTRSGVRARSRSRARTRRRR